VSLVNLLAAFSSLLLTTGRLLPTVDGQSGALPGSRGSPNNSSGAMTDAERYTGISTTVVLGRDFQQFWNIVLSGSSHTVTFGRVGTAGQTQTKEFDSEDEAKKAFDKLVDSKLKKGYGIAAAVRRRRLRLQAGGQGQRKADEGGRPRAAARRRSRPRRLRRPSETPAKAQSGQSPARAVRRWTRLSRSARRYARH